MSIYILFYSVNLLLSQLYSRIKNRDKILIMSFLFLNIFLCLNYDNGIDWTHYQITFLKTPSFFTEDYFIKLKELNIKGGEIFFIYLISIFKLIPNLNYEIFQYVILTIDLIYIYYFLKNNTKYPLLVIIFSLKFLTYMMFEPILRQLQAMIIFFIAIDTIKKNNFLKYYILNIIAILFHSSAIVLLPIYIFKNMKLTLKKTILGFTIAIFIIIFFKAILEKVFSISFLSHYKYYLFSKKYGYVENIDYRSLLKIIILDLTTFYFIYYLKNKTKLIIKNYNIISWIYFYSLIIKILSLKVSIFFRFNNYFFIIYIIYLCYLFQLIKKDFFKKITKIFLIIYFGLSFFKEINFWDKRDFGKYKPYSNYLFVKNENLKSKLKRRFKKIIDVKEREIQMKNLKKI